MPRTRPEPTQPAVPPARGVRAATFKLLVDTAMSLIQQSGHIPSVAELAARSGISRATAYRYFPSRSALVTTVIDASLGPVRKLADDSRQGRERVHELFKSTFPRFKEFEPQLRAAAQLALEQWALERAGLLEEEPYRRGHRIRIIDHALAPLEGSLAPALRTRLHKALCVIYGIEAYVILRDIWYCGDKELESTVMWMADALIDAALRESAKPSAAVQRRIPRKTGRAAPAVRSVPAEAPVRVRRASKS
jgi:AcrR family transcriptional regulator